MSQVITVEWLPKALQDIERLYTFLSDRNPEAAARAAACIFDGATLLETAPRIGRPMPDEAGESDEISRRELFVRFGAGAYVLRYVQVNDTVVIVTRVWHSREDRTALE